MDIIKQVWVTAGLWVGAITTVIIAIFTARQSGKQAEQRKEMINTLNEVRTSAKIDRDVSGASDTERKRLYKKWQRD